MYEYMTPPSSQFSNGSEDAWKHYKICTILNYLTVTGELAEPDANPISITAVWSSLTSTTRLLKAIRASAKTNFANVVLPHSKSFDGGSN